MLEIYENVENFNELCENVYFEHFNEKVTFDKFLINEDVFILNKDKYVVEDIEKYLDFHKYKPLNYDRKLSIINDFDNINIKIQNKLLKIFEENENHHIIVINNPNRILPTILSRGLKREGMKNTLKKLDNYPVRYHKIIYNLNLKEIDNVIVDKYLKFYDLLKKENYNEAYLYITTTFSDYDENLLYEVIQNSAGYKITLNMILDLQEKLFSNAQKKLQIENFLLKLTI